MRKTGLATALLCAGVLSAQTPPTTTSAPPVSNNNVGTANTAAQPNRAISLAEAIQMALQSNLDIQVTRFNPQIAEFNIADAYAVYEPDLRLGYTHNLNTSAGGFIPNTKQAISPLVTTSDDFNGSIGNGVAGYLPTGLTYSLSADLIRASRRQRSEDFSATDYTAFGNISLQQPLLRNMWIDPARAQIKINRVNFRLSEEQLRQQTMDSLFQTEQAYYNLIYFREFVKVQATALELSSQLLRENKKRVEVGAMAPLDEKQAESEVASTRAALIDAERQLSEQQNVLKGLITDKYADLNAVNLEPAEKLVAVPVISDVQDSWRHGLTQRGDLLQLKYAIERAGITLKLRKNQLWPELDLKGSYGHADRNATYGDTLADLPRGTSPSYSVGAVLDIPLGNRSARARYKGAKAAEQQALAQYKQVEQQIMVQIDDSVKLIRSSFERVEATRAARSFAQEALAAEQKKLENGKSTSFLVLQAQRDLTVRASEEIRALADYNIAVARLAWREGTTLERHNLQVK